MSNHLKNRAESHELRDEEIMYEIRVNTKKTGYTPLKKNKVHSDELKAEDFGCVDLGDVERASRLANIIGVVLAFGTVAVLITGFYWLLRVLIFMI